MSNTLKEELAAAIAAERDAWQAVKDRLPETVSHKEAEWQTWLAAVQRCREARTALDRAAPVAAGPGATGRDAHGS